jgi:RNA polymerase sigma-70 factor, ECF subfamily
VSIAFDDPRLVTRIRQREAEVLEAIVREYLPQVVRAARGAGLKTQEAEDVAQSTFITFLEKADTFEGRSHVRTWLFGILFRKIMEMRRFLERERHIDDIDEVMESRFDASGSWRTPPRSAEADFYSREVRERTAECLEEAPPKQRMAFVLREIEDLATEEICKILEVTITNLGVMLYRVRNRLRECLEAKGVWG